MERLKGKDIISLEKKVQKGIKFLDKTFGRKKWAKKIKPNVLDLGDHKKCMIGEVIGDYFDIEDEYHVPESKLKAMGFYVGGNDSEDQKALEYSVLTSVWLCALRSLGIRK